MADPSLPPPSARKHVLFQNADRDRPAAICDINGAVVLSMCRHCRRAESELDDSPTCPDAPPPPSIRPRHARGPLDVFLSRSREGEVFIGPAPGQISMTAAVLLRLLRLHDRETAGAIVHLLVERSKS